MTPLEMQKNQLVAGANGSFERLFLPLPQQQKQAAQKAGGENGERQQ
ncbi:MAG: hypothetical protein RQ754_04925 [Desulfuromonadales bacterium]|nr:hypothetical protein [Desulfuromonadales bacterium]